MKVHVGLKRDLVRSLKNEPREKAIEQVEELAKRLDLAEPNLERVVRFGVLTGDTDASKLPSLRSADEVDWVEADSVKSAL